MPYIPPQNRPAIDQAVETLAKEMATSLITNNNSYSISEDYRKIFMEISTYIIQFEKGKIPEIDLNNSQLLAKNIIDMSKTSNLKGGWQGELNYAITRLIQWTPFEMYQRKEWTEALRYWIYAQTVGALIRTSYEIHEKYENNWAANGMAGVFEDIKDEYKRRVNTSYEALQILKSGDCYEKSPYKTKLVEFEHAGTKGWIEIMQAKQEPK